MTKRLIFLRNLIAHECYTITEEELREMATLLGCLDELMENAKKELNKGGYAKLKYSHEEMFEVKPAFKGMYLRCESSRSGDGFLTFALAGIS